MRRTVSILSAATMLLAACSVMPAQNTQASPSTPPPAAAKPGSLTVDSIIQMTKAGISDDIIVAQLQKENHPFDLTTDQLLQLKTASVSDRVVKTMINPGSAPATSAAKTAASADPSLPTEVGVYAKQKEQWVEISPEVVNWKTGGVFKSFASGGIVKGDVNGHLNGKSSRNSLTTPLDFLIVVPEGTSVTEYQLLHLRDSGDGREFRTVTGGVFHAASGATRDLMSFDSKKIAPRTFSIILPPNVSAGEYGFLPPGAVGSANAAGSSGKLYSFHVIE